MGFQKGSTYLIFSTNPYIAFIPHSKQIGKNLKKIRRRKSQIVKIDLKALKIASWISRSEKEITCPFRHPGKLIYLSRSLQSSWE